MAKEDIAPGCGAQFGSWQSLLQAQRSFGPQQRLDSHCKSAHGGVFEEHCRACIELRSYVQGEPMDARDS